MEMIRNYPNVDEDLFHFMIFWFIKSEYVCEILPIIFTLVKFCHRPKC
jgi:hypothetical protein